MPFPRSQIYEALRKVRRKDKSLLHEDGDGIAYEVLRRYAGRAGEDKGFDVGALMKALVLPTVSILTEPRSTAMNAALIATLWDYAAPFEGALPGFAASPATPPVKP